MLPNLKLQSQIKVLDVSGRGDVFQDVFVC